MRMNPIRDARVYRATLRTVGVLLLTTSLLALPSAGVAQIIDVAPYEAAEGETLTLKGQGWAPNGALSIFWYGPDGEVREIETIQAKDDGAFELRFVPNQKLSAPRKGHWMAEVCPDDDPDEDIGDENCDLYDFIVK